MKQLLPWIKNQNPKNLDQKIKNQVYLLFFNILLVSMIWMLTIPQAATQTINTAPGSHGVNAVGMYTDLTLSDPSISSITFTLIGGDGGYATVHSYNAPLRANGGQGSTVTATFSVGNGAGEIPPGSTIRFVEGAKGHPGDNLPAGFAYDYGGGGGGSAVLFKAPSSSTWNLLAVAGGGGGAYQGVASGDNGQGGRSGANGGAGNGASSGSGGASGAGGSSNVSAGGGGGANSSGGNTCGHGGSLGGDGVGAGGNGDCQTSFTRNGGAGYGGGGAGEDSGGGGGGYSGGGAGGIMGGGGGGGSFSAATTQNITAGGSNGTHDDGSITYQVTLQMTQNQPPVAKCKNAIINLNANGNATLTTAAINNVSSDPEDGTNVTLSISKTSFDCTNVGPNTVTLTVTDTDGATATCTATVTVADPIAPNAVCQNITLQLNAAGTASILAAQIDGGSTDNCGSPTLTVVPNTFTCANIGPNNVSLRATDASGNQNSCNSIVTVEDNVDPVITCPADITVNNDPGLCGAMVSFNATVTDNCSAVVTYSPASGSFFPVGTTTVTATATDPSGNTNACTFNITVEDNEKPQMICQDITVQLNVNGDGSITPSDVDNGSSDNCGIASLAVFPSTFTCVNVGPNTVALTVTDIHGNTETCTSTVTVVDNVPPDAQCKNIIIQLDIHGQASIVPTDIDNGSTDACGIASYTASKTDFTCADLGNNTVTLTVTDVNGNSATCNAIVTVEDNIIPIVRTKNVMVVLDKDGNGFVTPAMINNGSTDNCTIVRLWLEGETEYDCGNTGVHEVVLKAQDQSGNIGSYDAIVTVKFYEPDFKNMHGVADGDTIHRIDCQVPWDISRYDLDYDKIKKHGTITTQVYRAELPEYTPWGMYQVWRYEYVIKDACAHTYRFNYYLALYDLNPPTYQDFPNDTTVAASTDVPPVDSEVKIIDLCQYVVWDTVVTMPILDPETGDTLGYTRRWMARDPSGHQSFRDQMIWLESGNRDQYSLITGRIADEDHIANTKFAGEAGTNGIPVSLYRLDEDAGTRTWMSSWTTGDWQGAQGTYYFVPEYPGSYQVKIDTEICLVDTLKFNKQLWSDTLEVAAGESLDQGWVITYECTDTASMAIEEIAVQQSNTVELGSTQSKALSDLEWRVFPNPASSYLRLDINIDKAMNYRLYDALGRSVKTGEYQRGQTIDIHRLNTGVYHLQLKSGEAVIGTKKVLIMD